MTEIGLTENRIIAGRIGRSSISIGRRLALVLAAFLIGALLAFYLYPIDYLLDRWVWWGTAHGDNSSGLIGYLYFAQDEWRWPLFHTSQLNPPGANIIFTDPIPVAALFGKIVFQLTGVLPLYMGAWTILSYGLQSLLSWLIFRHIGLQPAPAMAAAAIVALTPAFIYRLHIGLVAQFTILAAILFYLRTVTVASRREMALSSAAIGGILFVNPYLLAMSAPIFISGLMEAAWRKRISWGEAMALVAPMGVVAGALAFAFGIIGPGQSLPSEYTGFGIYSMNLLSPVVPQISSVFGHDYYLLDKTGGQYEGFNYLGAGLLLLILCALVFRFGSVRGLVTKNRFLAATLIGLTIFAASSKIYVGSWQVVDLRYETLPVLSSLTSVFRGSGRFFWPVGYIVIIGAVAVLARTMTQRTALLLIFAAIVIQLIDIRPLLSYVKAATQAWPAHLQTDSWARAANAHSEITLHPIFHCANPSDRDHILQLQLIAARANIPVNAAYLNRLPGVDCAGSRGRVMRKIDAESVTSNPLIVLFKDKLFVDGFLTSVLKNGAAGGFGCRDASFAFVCSRLHDNPTFVALGGEFEPLRLPLGKQLSIGQGGSGLSFMGNGWSSVDGDSRWANGDVTSLIGPLERSVCNTLTFKASILPFFYGDYFVRHAKVMLNGQSVGEITVSPGPQVISHSIALGGHCIEAVEFDLRFEALRTSLELGRNGDPRPLSWLFTWFSFAGD